MTAFVSMHECLPFGKSAATHIPRKQETPYIGDVDLPQVIRVLGVL